MDVEKCMRKRRTCREYQEKPVPKELLTEILDCARFAPSSGNLQNWRFIIVTDEERREAIADCCAEQQWMAGAPVQIVICNQQKDVLEQFPEDGKHFSEQNCAIIATHIMLKAEDCGLASAWVGAIDHEKLHRLLEIPDDVIPEVILAIGYPEVVHEDVERHEVKYLTYFEKWGEKEMPQASPQEKVDNIGTKIKQAKNRTLAKISSKLKQAKEKRDHPKEASDHVEVEE